MKAFLLLIAAAVGFGLSAAHLAAQGADPIMVPVHINANVSLNPYDDYSSFSLWMGDDASGSIVALSGSGGKTIAAMVPNQVYVISIETNDLLSANFSVVPPPGYTAQIDGGPYPTVSAMDTASHTVRILPNSQSGAADSGVASSFVGDHPYWQVSLGRLEDGTSAGWLSMGGSYLGADLSSLFTPDALQYVSPSPEVSIFYDSSGYMRQIWTDDVCVDIVTLSSTSYELNFFPSSDVAGESGGLLVFSTGSYPFISYVVSEGTGTNQISITSNTYSSESTVVRTAVTTLIATGSSFPYTWTTQDWHTSGTTAPVQIVVSNAGSTSSSSPEVIQVENSSGTVAATTTRLFAGESWANTWNSTGGYVLASKTLGSNSSTWIPETNQYYSDSSATESYGFPLTSSVNGHWVGYEYQSNSNFDGNDGVISKIHQQYLNSTTTVPTTLSSDTSGAVTSYTYRTDSFGIYSKPTLIQTVYNAITTSYASIAYQGYTSTVMLNSTPIVVASRTDYAKDNSGDSQLVSQVCSYREDVTDEFYCGKPCLITRPNGTMDAYAYQRGSYTAPTFTTSGLGSGACSRVTVIHGTTQSSDITGSSNSEIAATSDGYSFVPTGASSGSIASLYVVAGKSTEDITIRDQYAHVVHTETDVWNGSVWVLVQSVDYAYDSVFHHVVSQTANNGVTVAYTYAGEQLSTKTDTAGVVTTYSYDTAGRISGVSKTAANITSTSASTLSTSNSYDGASHVIQQVIGGSITSGASYDDAGRLTGTTDPNSGTTSYAYSPSTYTTTVTLPNGGQRVDTTYPDDHLVSESGSGVVSRYFNYTINSDGTLTTTVYRNYSTSSDTSPRYESVQTDLLGRTLQTVQPTANSGATYTVQNIYDSTYGWLDETTRSDGAHSLGNLLYQYDAMAQPYRQGLKYGSSGTTLSLSSSDQITDTNSDIELLGSPAYWWKTTKAVTYPGAGSSTPFTVRIVRDRLTGLDSGTIADRQITDAYGNVTETTIAVNSTTNIVTASTTITGLNSSTPATVTTVAGLTTSETGFDQLTTSIGYDSLWRPSTRQDSRGNTTTTSYVSGTTLAYQVTDATGANVATYAYDSAGRVTSSTNANGKVTLMSYNELNEVTNQWGDIPYPVQYAYDAYGQRTTMSIYQSGSSWNSSTWPGGTATGTTTWNYDAASGLLTSKTDSASQSVSYTYNNFGQPTQRTWARGTTSRYAYDSYTGQLTGLTYSDSTPSVSYSYARFGQLSGVSDATGSRTFYYDSTVNSNPLELESEQLDSSFYGGRWLSRLYDTSTSSSAGSFGPYEASLIMGRPVGFRLGSTENSSSDLLQYYTYSNQGQFVGVQAASSTTSNRDLVYSYLSSSNLVSGYAGTGSSFTVNRAYEANRDLLTTIQGEWSSTVVSEFDYLHNSLYQTSSVTQSGTAFTGYGPSNEAIFRQMTYDNRGELSSDVGFLGSDLSNTSMPLPDRNFCYGYDDIGDRTFSNYTGSDTLKETYSANDLNQYSSRENLTVPVSGNVVDNSGVSVALSTTTSNLLAGRQGSFWAVEAIPPLNSGGNPVNLSSPATFSATLTVGLPNGVSSGVNQTTSSTLSYLTIPPQSQSFTYDADGNLTADGMWTYTYDAENRLIGMQTSTAAASGAAHNYTLTFTYDYMGRRVEKDVYDAVSGVTTYDRYVYAGWNLIADIRADASSSGSYTMRRTFSWGLDVTGDLTATGGVGALLEMTNFNYTSGSLSGTTDYFPTYDGNGNIASLVNASSGVVAAAYEYSPFGEPLRAQANDSAVADNPFRFSTKFTDVESGFSYYGSRFYSPHLGRFINRDPSEEAGGINLYGFVSNDPANSFDVLGNDQYWPDVQGPAQPYNPYGDPTNPVSLDYWDNMKDGELSTQGLAESQLDVAGLDQTALLEQLGSVYTGNGPNLFGSDSDSSEGTSSYLGGDSDDGSGGSNSGDGNYQGPGYVNPGDTFVDDQGNIFKSVPTSTGANQILVGNIFAGADTGATLSGSAPNSGSTSAGPYSVTVQSYIAASSVDGFAGDGHGPTSSPSVGTGYRTTSTFTFDPSNPSAPPTVTSATGTTTFLGIFSGQASASGLGGSESSSAPGVYQVVMYGAASNPLVPGAPPIAYSVVVSINTNTGTTGGFITQTQFPSMEVFVNNQPVYSRPETGTPMNLYNTVSNPFGHWPP